MNATVCLHQEVLALTGHLVGLSNRAPAIVVRVCITCASGWEANGTVCVLCAEDAAQFAAFSKERATMRQAVADGTIVSAHSDQLPSPKWFPRLGLVPTLDETRVLPMPHPIIEPELRATIRRHFGREARSDVATVQTPVGNVTVDWMYEDHFFDIDRNTGCNRCNVDHISYLPQVLETLKTPIEVWEVQDGGKRTRRRVFLKLFLQGDVYVYQLAVATRDGRLLTAHRIKGFTACQNRRRGKPLYIAY